MSGANHRGKVAGIAFAMATGTILVVASCGGSSNASSSNGGATGGTSGIQLGDDHTGIFNDGPVDWAETEWHNGCAGDDGYPQEIQNIDGNFLGGVSNEVGAELFCDACVEIAAANGKKLIVRVITYGVVNQPGDMDLSPEAYNALRTSDDEAAREMTWHLVTCADTNPIYFQFQVGSNTGWSRFWVRNPRAAIAKVEVQSHNHSSFTALTRESDGAFVDYSGFGNGAFMLRITGVDGSTLDQSFNSYPSGQLIKGSTNLQ
ncbi:MAG: hypothetical protein FWD69_04780 [Polyangiaceae bacterium]|nr:hypothetical protein [Polyangiaceae bacterium]